MSSNLCVFTTVESEQSAALLRRSCERVNIDLQLYGTGNWKGYADGKIRGALEFLRTRTEYICMFVDGHDSFLLNGEEEILDVFQSRLASIVISCEKTCWPDASLGSSYLSTIPPTPWQYPNAGGWIGTRAALVRALDKMSGFADTWPGDDQRCWHEYCLNWHRIVDRDTCCQIFQTMGGTGEMYDDGTNIVTYTKPMVWHFNGRTPGREEWYQKLTGDRL